MMKDKVKKIEMDRMESLVTQYLKPIEPLFKDDSVTEIYVDGPDNVYVQRDGLMCSVSPEHRFASSEALVDAITQLARESNIEIGGFIDTVAPNGARISASVPHYTNVPQMTIRKQRGKPMTVSDLVRYGSITVEIYDLLVQSMLGGANIVVSGPTNSGKSTLLRMLAGELIDNDNRIVLIESQPELDLCLHRGFSIEISSRTQDKESSMTDALYHALRNNPDNLIIGEIRTYEELKLYLETLDSGYSGTLVTTHAKSALDTLRRFENLIFRNSQTSNFSAIQNLVRPLIDCVVHTDKNRYTGERYVSEVAEIIKSGSGESYELNTLWRYDVFHGGFIEINKSDHLKKFLMKHLEDSFTKEGATVDSIIVESD